MEIKEKIMLDMLTAESVSVVREKYIDMDGKEVILEGQNIRKAYVNNVYGRTEIETELEEPYLSSVMAIWGNAPTVE